MGVIWITGLSGSGKTTLSKELIKHTLTFKWIHLDGDQLRPIFATEQKYDKHSRLELAIKYSKLASMISSQGHNVIVSTISLFHEIHKWNRANIINYFEVFIDARVQDLHERDNKKIYSSTSGLNVIGVDLEYDKPTKSHYVIKQNFEMASLQSHINNIISKVEWLPKL